MSHCRDKRAKSLGGLVGRDKPPVNQTLEQRAQMEMDTYLGEEVTDGDKDPLAWWKVHEKCFPLMSNMAQKYLFIPATSTPSERVLNTAGNIATNLGTSLNI